MSGGADGGQTGNSLSITITGNGDNTIDTSQENNGDQTIQEASGEGTNNLGPNTTDPAPAIATAASALTTLGVGAE